MQVRSAIGMDATIVGVVGTIVDGVIVATVALVCAVESDSISQEPDVTVQWAGTQILPDVLLTQIHPNAINVLKISTNQHLAIPRVCHAPKALFHKQAPRSAWRRRARTAT